MAISDLLAPAMQVGSTVLSAGSQLSRGDAALTIARRRRAQLEFQASQLETEAGQAKAVGQVGAQDIARQTAIVNSAALARAAASGAGASDPTVLAVMSRTAGEGAYRQALALYEGEAQARIDNIRASAARYEGATQVADATTAKSQSNIGAASTILSGGARAMTMFDKYYAGPKSAGTASNDDDIMKTAFTNPEAEDV